jgi:ketosteroid isomerase-like protein
MPNAEANLVIARRITAAFEQGDDATLRALYAPDHVMHEHWHAPLPLPGCDDQPLLDRYEQSDRNARADMTGLRVTVDKQIACGDWVVTVFTSHWTHTRRGTAVAERGISVDRIADGQVVETWVTGDRLGLLQQLGVVGPSQELFTQADLTL